MFPTLAELTNTVREINDNLIANDLGGDEQRARDALDKAAYFMRRAAFRNACEEIAETHGLEVAYEIRPGTGWDTWTMSQCFSVTFLGDTREAGEQLAKTLETGSIVQGWDGELSDWEDAYTDWGWISYRVKP